MKKIFFIIFFLIYSINLNAGNEAKVYFAGGCFWCMEESFDKVKGVLKTTSGYSGGHVKNPKYNDVVKNKTGHYETLEIIYDSSKTNFEKLLDYHKAQNCYEKIIEINKNYSLAHYNLGNVFEELGEYKKAIISYENAICC